MKRNLILILIGLLSLNFIGCMNNDNDIKSKSEQKENVSIEDNTTDQKDTSETAETSNIVEKSTKNDTKKNNTESKEIVKPKEQAKDSIDNSKQKTATSNDKLKEKVINYIINGQGNKSEAEKLKWSESFLNKVNIEPLYKKFTENGGNTNDLGKFAEYITLNAPIPSNWKNLFETDFYNRFGQKVVKLEHLENDLYQAYIKTDNKEIPYVVVSSRTGYFHG